MGQCWSAEGRRERDGGGGGEDECKEQDRAPCERINETLGARHATRVCA